MTIHCSSRTLETQARGTWTVLRESLQGIFGKRGFFTDARRTECDVLTEDIDEGREAVRRFGKAVLKPLFSTKGCKAIPSI